MSTEEAEKAPPAFRPGRLVEEHLGLLTAALAALSLLAFIARVWRLGVQSLWVDEALSVLFSSKDLPDLLKTVVAADIHPPFYHLVLHYWIALAGRSEFAVRFPSLAFGLLTVPLAAKLALAVYGGRGGPPSRRVGVAAALASSALVALSPFFIYYSQEARNYVVVAFWGLLASFALWKALDAPAEGRWSRRAGLWWAVYALSSALALYTHYYAIFVLLFQAVYLSLTWAQYRLRLWPYPVALVAVALAYLPWLPGAVAQLLRLQTTPDFWPGTLNLGEVLKRVFLALSIGTSQAWQTYLPMLALFGVLILLGSAPLLRSAKWASRRGILFLLLYLIVPIASVYLLSLRTPKFAERYLLVVAPPFYLLLAFGLGGLYSLRTSLGQGRLSRPVAALFWAVCALVLGASAVSAYQVYYSDAFAKDDFRSATAYIAEKSQPGDVIVLMMDTSQAFPYYYRGDLPWQGLQPGDDFQYAADRLNELSTRYERMWLLLWNPEWADPSGFVRDSLDANLPRVLPDKGFHGLQVRLYFLGWHPTFSANFAPKVPLAVNFEGKLRLVGLEPPAAPTPAGHKQEMTLYWEALEPLDQDYVVSLRLKAGGFYWGHAEKRPANYWYPTTSWKPGRVVRGAGELAPLAGTPPGEYEVEVGVYSVTAQRDLAVWDERGIPVGTGKVVTTTVVVLPPSPPSLEDLGEGVNPLGKTFAQGLELVAVASAVKDAPPGAAVPLSLFWRARAGTPADSQAALSLRDATGKAWELSAATPGQGQHPPSTWAPGEVVRDQRLLRLPLDAVAGKAQILVALKGAGTAAEKEEVVVAELNIVSVERQMTPPKEIQYPLAYSLEEVAQLVGYSLDREAVRAGETLRLTLYWRALGTPATSYTVFTHLLDGQERIWAQMDSLPRGGAAPTTTWVRGQYLKDEYELAVRPDAPPGRYTLEVGMYDAATGQRLRVSDASGVPSGDRILLPTPISVLP